MNLLSQPFDGQLGEHLIQALDSGEFQNLSVVVAFAKNSGVLRLRDSLQRFRNNGGELHICVGLDMNGTSYEALVNLLSVATSLRVVHDENGQTFHTKLFNLTAAEKSELIVGSHNLTSGGLWTNFESSIRLELDLQNPSDLRLQTDVDDYLSTMYGLEDTALLIEDEDHVQTLLSNHYVEKEVQAQIRRRRNAKATKSSESLFGSSTPANLPSLPKTPKEGAAPSTTPKPTFSNVPNAEKFTDPTLWLETRKMTGGSRNILDLSKTSLLKSGDVAGTQYEHPSEALMRGAVEFFGVDPDDTDAEKQITINFEGNDYAGNTIKFPTGKHANGTWRVQINGTTAEGTKITSAFKELATEGYLLPEKIVTFTRLAENYYSFSVFHKDDLPEFEESSAVTAYNGGTPNSRMLGII